jgi:hypothetical protein
MTMHIVDRDRCPWGPKLGLIFVVWRGEEDRCLLWKLLLVCTNVREGRKEERKRGAGKREEGKREEGKREEESAKKESAKKESTKKGSTKRKRKYLCTKNGCTSISGVFCPHSSITSNTNFDALNTSAEYGMSCFV